MSNYSQGPTSIRFDQNDLATLRASRPGWQTRMKAALSERLKNYSPAQVTEIPRPRPV
jgi:uncharacterized protein (DUF4415 family)